MIPFIGIAASLGSFQAMTSMFENSLYKKREQLPKGGNRKTRIRKNKKSKNSKVRKTKKRYNKMKK
jgi:hypothetical protein